MTLLAFEGFETIGTDTGVANEALVNPRLAKRFGVYNHDPTGHMYLITGEDGLGYAWNMNFFANYIYYDLPDSLSVLSGGDSPIFVMGALIHVPFIPRSFCPFCILHDGSFEPGLWITDSSDIEFKVSGTIYETVEDAVLPGHWSYIEFRIRADGSRGPQGEAEVTGTPLDGATSINMTNTDVYLDSWALNNPYTTGDEVRYNGRAYEALQDSTGLRPDLNTDYWLDIGTEDANKGAVVPFGTDFYFEGHPEYIYTTTSAGTSSINFTPALDEDNFLPVETDAIYFGERGIYEVVVNGTTIMSQEGVKTMIAGDFRTLEDISFNGTTDGGGQDFTAFDDIYILDDSDEATGFLGPVHVQSTIPTGDVTAQWDADPDTTPHYPLINANASPGTTNVYTTEDGYIEKYTHASLGAVGSDPVFGVKMEVEVQNNTAGNPSLGMAIVSGASEESDSIEIENTGDSVVESLIAEEDPAGGSWDVSAVDLTQLKITFDSGV